MKNMLLIGLAAGIGAAMVVGRRKPEDDRVGTMSYWSSASIPPAWPSTVPVPYAWWPQRAWWPRWRRRHWGWGRPRRWWWPR
ncbi:MAG TPA: hypothetical protein VFA98_13040 [Thermoanaerobaculia bacterium]|nr:hypothetical protein [Thermoanaerobaculia bacterium]